MRLAVKAEKFAAGVDRGHRIEMRLVGALEKAEGQDDIQLSGQRLESGNALVAFDRAGQFEIFR